MSKWVEISSKNTPQKEGFYLVNNIVNDVVYISLWSNKKWTREDWFGNIVHTHPTHFTNIPNPPKNKN